MKTETQIALQYEQLLATFNERTRREWAASEALALGRGGVAMVHRATGIAPSTIGRGIRQFRECAAGADLVDPTRVRKVGGGRGTKIQEDVTLLGDLERLVEPVARGDPESPLRWTCKSLRNLARELVAMRHEVSYRTIGTLLKTLGYSLQGNRKTVEGNQHPDRNAQFEYINDRTTRQHANGNPAVSVDTKKKELVGNYKNVGRELCPHGEPTKVDVHDFMGDLGRASPYGVYDIGDNVGWVSVGISADTSEFAVESLRRWWKAMGVQRYPGATELLITADCGGSNGYRVRLWKLELQKLANELGIPVTVCHLPPGTSKWNKIEHKMFSFITQNWRGKPLVDYQTIISLIAATKTEKGLQVRSDLDDNVYEKGRKVSDAELAAINITPHTFHGEWNYTIGPCS
jgi:hypothetical protein